MKVARAKCPVFEDNILVIQLANVPKMTPRLKHIALHYHFFRDQINNNTKSNQRRSNIISITTHQHHNNPHTPPQPVTDPPPTAKG